MIKEKKAKKDQAKAGKGSKLKDKKTELAKNLKIAQNSTASLGKFDKQAHKMEQVKKVKKKLSKANFNTTTKSERLNYMDILGQVTKSINK